MADSANTSSGNNNALYFIVGAMFVAIVVLGFMVFNGNLGGDRDKVDITIQTPKVEAPKTQ